MDREKVHGEPDGHRDQEHQRLPSAALAGDEDLSSSRSPPGKGSLPCISATSFGRREQMWRPLKRAS
jgi:hypothetical protein